jgi:hypothetical protein
MIFLVVPLGEAATAHALPIQQVEGASSSQLQSTGNSPTPDAQTTQPATQTDNPAVPPAQTTDSKPQSTPPQTTPAQPPSTTQGPVGTAAAPYEKGVGVAASRPAGAVIAPAKQKRARSILIKVSVILGAAAAIGTVVALSSASPSKPH